MFKQNFKFNALSGLVTLLLVGCVSDRGRDVAHFQTGESMVLVGQQPAQLRFCPDLSRPVLVRNTYLEGLPQTRYYERGRDFVISEAGYIQRSPDSSIPDFSTNILYGKEDFDHRQFPGYGNGPFFVYVDYFHHDAWHLPHVRPEFSAARLPETRRRLREGRPLRIIAYGDSITAGGEASQPSLIFWERWADALRRKYPRSSIETINGATGGDSTVQGLQRLSLKVLTQRPDLVLIGFGMNDHNRGGVTTAAFASNLLQMIVQIREATPAEVILYSTFPPNPDWHFGSQNMAAYAETIEQVAREAHCAYADVYHFWSDATLRKKPEDLLANNINHPNDYGHWIYFQALQALDL